MKLRGPAPSPGEGEPAIERMKIALSVDAISSEATGIGRYALELARGSAANPNVAELICYRDGLLLPSPDACLAPRVPLSIGQQMQRWGTMRFGWGLKGALFHGPNFFLPERIENGIVTVHDLSVLRFPETHPPERVRIFEARFESTLKRAAHIITDSETVRGELLTTLGVAADRVTSVHLGVSRTFSARPDERQRLTLRRLLAGQAASYILCVATFEPRKRIEQAVLAHAELAARRVIPPLVLAGAGGWHNDALQELIKRQSRNGSLVSLGWVAEKDLPALYTGAKLFLYPSTYEGFGLPPIEAMASGVPTIVSNRSCLPEITAGAAMLIDPDDIHAFSAAIERGLEDDSWRAQSIEAGLKVAAGYTWERCVEETVKVYREVWACHG
jgi:glycosyltransferase involved in cell wall biosynthesis